MKSSCRIAGLLLQFGGCLVSIVTIATAAETTSAADAVPKPRVIATTDGEVDDRSSMIRFLLYASDFDVAGIVEVNSRFQKQGHSKELWIEEQLKAYEQVLPNLRKHNADYPSADALRSVMRIGNENSKDLYVDPPQMETKNTAGAQLIIDTLLDDDPRPVHVLSWGGANTTASALWKLKTQYSKDKFQYAASRIRIYCIWYQDGGGSWIQENVPEAYIYEAYRWDNVWDYESFDSARTKDKPSANPKAIQQLMKPAWLNKHIKHGHGPLTALTPQSYISEGDTPLFLNLVNNGLHAEIDYTLGGWGGRAAKDNAAQPNHPRSDRQRPAIAGWISTHPLQHRGQTLKPPSTRNDPIDRPTHIPQQFGFQQFGFQLSACGTRAVEFAVPRLACFACPEL